MTLILGPPAGPRRADLADGVVLLARPASGVDWEIAASTVRARIAAAREGGEVMARYGLPADVVEHLAALEVSNGFGAHAIAIELGVRTVTAIEGVMLPDGTTPPADATNLAALFQARSGPAGSRGMPTYGELFLAWQEGQRTLSRAEGERSPAAPNGAGPAGDPIAPIADASSDPVPEADPTPNPGGAAPSTSTRRRPTPATPPGDSPSPAGSSDAPA